VDEPVPKENPPSRAKARKAEAVHCTDLLAVVADRVLHAGPVKPRFSRAPVQGVPSGAQESPACAGPCILEIGGRLQLGFAQLECHETRRGIEVIRHMHPWWEPWSDELDELQMMLDRIGKT
jgi:hypothetical protein